jgi:UDP-N-acetylmuramoylalanine-D-glutamate ligase
VIGVTGSFGKTTTTRFAAALVGGVFCGNDRESFCDLAALARQPRARCMAFEASNRHLRNGWRRLLDVGVLTGISLNHEPDHGSFEAYRKVKYSMAARCRYFLYHAAIPAAFPDAAGMVAKGVSASMARRRKCGFRAPAGG